MCCGYSSSRIDEDLVHRQWNGGAPVDEGRLPTGKRWFEDKNFILTELFRHPEQIKQLEFLGGETLLIKEVGDILEYLIDAGVADNIVLMATTNGTVVKSPWLGLTENFKELRSEREHRRSRLSITSIFGILRGGVLSHGTSRLLEKQSRTRLTAIVTLQAYNALNVVQLFKYLDSIGLDFYAYPVRHPPLSQSDGAASVPRGGWPLSAVRSYAEWRLSTEES